MHYETECMRGELQLWWGSGGGGGGGGLVPIKEKVVDSLAYIGLAWPSYLLKVSTFLRK